MAVNVIKEKCRGCSICVKNCPFEAITMENKLAVIGPACTGCGVCVEKCPFKAIEKTEEEKEEVRQMYGELWERIKKRISCGEFRMLVIDEFMAAYRYGLIDREEALEFLTGKPEALEIVLTGRDPAPELTALADYVSEIRKVKHPFDQGILARRGIEY